VSRHRRDYELIRDALLSDCDGFDRHEDFIAAIHDLFERHVRRHSGMGAAQFDLAFADLNREIEDLVTTRLGGFIDVVDAASVIADLLGEERREATADVIRETTTGTDD
jgi:hypothetical protein